MCVNVIGLVAPMRRRRHRTRRSRAGRPASRPDDDGSQAAL